MYSAGGNLLSDNQPNLVNEGAMEALQLWSQLLADGSAVNSQPERGYEQSDFIKGRVAMQITGPWTLGYLPETGVDFGVFPFPVKEEPAAVVGGENLFIMKTSSQREQAAWKFLEYAVGQEFQQQWALQTGYLPANLKARRSDAYQEFIAEQPSLQVFLDQMQWAHARPIVPQYARLSRNLGRAIESVLLGKSPQEALEQSQSRLKRTWNPSQLNWQETNN
jgi:multiple sugar transport system substrate-binding protein